MRRLWLNLFWIGMLLAGALVQHAQAQVTKAVVHYAQQTGPPAKQGPLLLGATVQKVLFDKPAIGQITIIAAEEKSLNYNAIVKGLRQAGFIVRCVQFTATGTFNEQKGQPAFQVSMTDEMFLIKKCECPGYHHKPQHGRTWEEISETAKSSPGKTFVVSGCVTQEKPEKGKKELVLHLMTFEEKVTPANLCRAD